MPDDMSNAERKKDFRYKSEIFVETHHLVEEMLKNPIYAHKAIKDRNLIIRGLNADINHRKVAFQEIEERYGKLADENEILKNRIKEFQDFSKNLTAENLELKESLKQKDKDLASVNLELGVQKVIEASSWDAKINKLADKLPRRLSFLVKFFLTTQVFKFFLFILFAVLFVASLTGWGYVSSALKPLLALFI